MKELRVVPSEAPIPSGPGTEGHGEGVKIGGDLYFYRCPFLIPKDKVAVVMWEGNYCGRQRGDREYALLAWDTDAFVVIAQPQAGEVRKAMKRFSDMTPAMAIQKARDDYREATKWLDDLPPCMGCKRGVIVFDEGQPRNVCLTCFRKQKEKK